MKWRFFLISLLVFGLLFLLFWYNAYRVEGPQIGDALPLDSLLMEAGLNEAKADYYLLKFWGSWCAPCRKTHPEWIRVHSRFNPPLSNRRNLVVIAIALEADSSNWRMAVEKDQLPWEGHIIQSQELDSGWAGKLAVKSVPETILLASDGMILGRNMKPEEVQRFLRHRLTE